MANMSTATGTLDITSPNAETIRGFVLKVINPWAKDGEYGISEPIEEPLDIKLDPITGEYALSESFTGYGKGTWTGTITHLRDTIMDAAGIDYLHQLMNGAEPIVLYWAFADIEPNMGTLYQQDIAITIGGGDFTVESATYTPYAYTYSNACELGLESEFWTDEDEE